jgi:hypothetical protein
MITPLIFPIEDDEVLELSEDNQPGKTYRFDIDTGEIFAEFIDGSEAVKQAVSKYIKTVRDKYLIYSSDYGCEILYLLGNVYSKEYLDMEVPRFIDECLSVDNRIIETSNYKIELKDDKLYVSFDVITENDDITEIEVTL